MSTSILKVVTKKMTRCVQTHRDSNYWQGKNLKISIIFAIGRGFEVVDVVDCCIECKLVVDSNKQKRSVRKRRTFIVFVFDRDRAC